MPIRRVFERGARRDAGGDGWADVWKRHHFAWEYKGRRANLDAAFNQLRQYALALENPPLLIVSDMVRFRIRTNWTNSVSRTHEFELDDLADAATRDKLKWAFSDPERLRPGETRQSLTERVAASFASVAQALRERGHDPQAVAHFVNRLVFCMFADDVGLLPDHMFTRMLRHALPAPARFGELAGELFRAMASGGRVGFETVAVTGEGGDVLLVEAACLPGRGTLHVTGTVGPMMRESANVAMTWVRSHAERLAGAARFDDTTDVHVHLAEAARWKDGPSAGVTLAVALVSALTGQPVRGDAAMSGELTLAGTV